MDGNLVCWKCGEPLGDTPLPLSRYARCRGCGADLYACRLCRHFDAHLAVGCREERAEDVRERESANFCDWFELRLDAWDGGRGAAGSAGLAALFGEGGPTEASNEADEARRALEALFGK